MLLSAGALKGFTLHAIDGEIGRVKEIYFDDATWTVRYLVVETGGWLGGRSVLISPIAVGRVHPEARTVDVGLTKELVKNSPDVDYDQPISRQYEAQFHDYYGWPYYWAGAGILGGVAPLPLAIDTPAPREETREGDDHLRSTAHIAGFFGYHIHATDGDIGHVADFIVEDGTWRIRYLVVDTSNWGVGRRVLISPDVVGLVSWADKSVCVGVSSDAIKTAPPWSSDVPIDRRYEAKLYEHYRRSPYWEKAPSAPSPPSARRREATLGR